MTATTAVLAIAGALLVGAISPGPSFVVVARNSIGQSRGHGLFTALGMGIGGVVFSGIALAGLYSLLATVGWLYAALKIAGAAYLLYLAVKIWRGAKLPLDLGLADVRTPISSFWVGVTTQLSNPKTAIVYGSIFASLLPQHPPLWCYFALPPLAFVIEGGWYSVVALGFSSRRPRELYLRAKKWIDRVAAGVIALLGFRLAFTATQSGV